MGFLTDLFSGGASKLVDSVGSVLDNVVTTKEEKMQLENELKKAEMQHEVDMAKISIEDRKLIYDDIGSARTRETEVMKSEHSTKLAKNIASYLALGTTIITFGLFGTLIFYNKVFDPSVKDIVVYILGVLSAILTQVYSYYFGSSSGSAAKSKTIDSVMNKM